ncbi:MFS transporter [Streptomyces rubiginosohelvolus]|uniref:MFS transporter n=1 Tax=Streptomyces rubiginosohelvolus TaxID=67362 RepID=UPI0035DD8D51
MSDPQVTSRTAGTLGGRKQIALLVLCAQLFLDSMDVSLMGVALPELKDDLGLSAEELQWIISGYAVAYGGFLLLGGRAADLFGRRRMFFWGTAVFAVASLAGGFVSDGTLLIVSRVIKGVAAAFIAPAALSIIMTTFKEGPERNRAVGIFSLTGASGYAAGLVLSGVLTELNWRLTFFVPFVIAALVLAAVRYAVSPDPVRDGERPGFDAFGAVTATGGVLLLVFALTRAPEVGWGSAATVLSLVASVALLVAFVIIQNRRAEPLVQLSIFRSRTLSTANVVGLTWACATIGWQFVALLYLQQVLDYSALGAGAAIVPMAAAILVTVNVTPRVINRFGLRVPAVAGLLLQGLGILLFLRADESSEYVTVLLPALILHGIGNGLSFPSFNVAGVSGVADEQQGLATSLIQSALQLGGGLGVAVAAAVLATGGEGGLASYHRAFLAVGLFSLAGALAAALGLGPARTPEPDGAADAPDAADAADGPKGAAGATDTRTDARTDARKGTTDGSDPAVLEREGA